jgi:hypothetical protein
MKKTDFIEVSSKSGVTLIAISSIAFVEPFGNGATIVMKELDKNNVSYVIVTESSYYAIKQATDNWQRI